MAGNTSLAKKNQQNLFFQIIINNEKKVFIRL